MNDEYERAHNMDVTESNEVAKVVVHWVETTSGARGEIYIPPLIPSQWVDEEDKAGSDSDSLAASVRAFSELTTADISPYESVMEMRCAHTDSIIADFEQHPIPFVVPVDVFVKNTGLVSRDVDAAFTALPASIADRSRGRFWSGDVSMTLRNVPPGAERRLRLSAILTSYSVFDLSELLLSVPSENKQPEIGTTGEKLFVRIVPSTICVRMPQAVNETVTRADNATVVHTDNAPAVCADDATVVRVDGATVVRADNA
mmetsp:Transcript_948/g.2975  ORF Transcript_948/g.2975 Transcript_948/m.2975 type:complete len:258 (+) Transcript_948:220-993(+)